MQPGSKLTQRLQQIQIVATHKVLGQTNNGHHQRDLKNEEVRRLIQHYHQTSYICIAGIAHQKQLVQ